MIPGAGYFNTKNCLLKPALFLQYSFLQWMHSRPPLNFALPSALSQHSAPDYITPIKLYSPYILCIRLTNELLKGRNMIYSPLCAIFSVRTQYLEHRSLINVSWLKELFNRVYSLWQCWCELVNKYLFYLSQQIPFGAKLSFLDSWIERPTFCSHFLSKI